MTDKLFLITYESANWCGAADTHVVVRAESPEDAEDKASDHMWSEMEELFSDEYGDLEDSGEDDESNVSAGDYTVISVEEFDETHEFWKYFIDETQSQFFPLVE